MFTKEKIFKIIGESYVDLESLPSRRELDDPLTKLVPTRSPAGFDIGAIRLNNSQLNDENATLKKRLNDTENELNDTKNELKQSYQDIANNAALVDKHRKDADNMAETARAMSIQMDKLADERDMARKETNDVAETARAMSGHIDKLSTELDAKDKILGTVPHKVASYVSDNPWKSGLGAAGTAAALIGGSYLLGRRGAAKGAKAVK